MNNAKTQYFDLVNTDDLIKKYPNLTVLKDKASSILIGKIRNKNLKMSEFKKYSSHLIKILLLEAMACEYKKEVVCESPLGEYKTLERECEEKDYIGVSILRSGNAMMKEYMELFPECQIGTILVQRNESSEKKEPVLFYEKFPKDIVNKKVFLLDPMLATAGSCSTAIDILLKRGIKEKDIIFVNIISAVEGIEILFQKYPDVTMVTAKVDPVLLPNKYIAPGLGDFGDRFFGTD